MKKYVLTFALLLVALFSFGQVSIKQVQAYVNKSNQLLISVETCGQTEDYTLNVMIGNVAAQEPLSWKVRKYHQPGTVNNIFPVTAGKSYEVRVILFWGKDTALAAPMIVEIPEDSGIKDFREYVAEVDAGFLVDAPCVYRDSVSGKYLMKSRDTVAMDTTPIFFNATTNGKIKEYAIRRFILSCPDGSYMYWIENLAFKDSLSFDAAGKIDYQKSTYRNGGWLVLSPFGEEARLSFGDPNPLYLFRVFGWNNTYVMNLFSGEYILVD